MILSRAEIDHYRKIYSDHGYGLPSWATKEVLDTLAASQAALEAWIWWDTKLADGEETALDYDKAVELTKRAGIELPSEAG